MSCIFRTEDGLILLMCKGADSVIEQRLTSSCSNSKEFRDTKNIVNGYANEGLRTLYLAQRIIPEDEF